MGHRRFWDGAAALLSLPANPAVHYHAARTFLSHFIMRGMIPPLLVVGPNAQDAQEIQLRPSSCTATLPSAIQGPSLVIWYVR